MSYSSDLLDGFDLLYKRTDAVLKTNSEISNFFKKLSSIEKEYAKSLQRLAKEQRKDLIEKAPQIQKEVGTTLNAWDVVLKELEKVGDYHNQNADKLDNDLSKAISNHVREKQKQRSKLEGDGKKLTKDFKIVKENLERARQKYVTASKDAEVAEAVHTKGKGDLSMKPSQLVKLATKSTQAQERATAADNEYTQTLTLTNQKQVEYYVQSQPSLLNEFQLFEEDRLKFMKEIAEKYATMESEKPSFYTTVYESIYNAIQSISIENDIQTFVNENRTGVTQPGDIQYMGYEQQEIKSPVQSTNNNPKLPPGKIGKYKGPASNDVLTTREWGLTNNDRNNLTIEEQQSKLRGQLNDLDKAISSETKSKEGLENLIKFYASDPAAQQKAQEQVSDVETKLQKLQETRNSVQTQIEEIGGTSFSANNSDSYDYNNNTNNSDSNSSYPQARAVYDYNATCDTELTFKAGEILFITEQDTSGWWYAMKDGQYGYVPNNYVELV